MSDKECEEYGTNPADDTELLCWLPAGHDGPHYDRADDLTWRITVTPGKPETESSDA